MFLKRPSFWRSKNLISLLLLPISFIYLLCFYSKKFLIKERKLKQKIITVGNLTIGGAGKTPVAIALYKLLARDDIIFLSRGYGGNYNDPFLITNEHSVSQTGDEAILLSKEGQVVLAKQCYKAEDILNDLQSKIIIMDDGLQHFSIFQDIKILVIDGNYIFGNNFVLPSGPLRELKSPLLKKSDIIIFLNNNKLSKELLFFKNKIFFAKYIEDGRYNKQVSYMAFSALADNEKFFTSLKKSGFLIKKEKMFADHYFYKEKDIELLLKESEGLKLITTSKDMTKIAKKYHKFIVEYKIQVEIDKADRLKKILINHVG